VTNLIHSSHIMFSSIPAGPNPRRQLATDVTYTKNVTCEEWTGDIW